MEIFEKMGEFEHEQVVFGYDARAGYRGIIAIHDTTLGPALGGTRFWRYATEEEALGDVLRLARGMTYKASIAGLDLGGGKSVILAGPDVTSRELLFRAHGRLIESLKGRYITAEDVGTNEEDMDYVAMETEYVTGTSSRSGDPSPLTAYGTFQGVRAAARERYGSDALDGLRIAVQGLGHVGYHLCRHLHQAGAELVVTDIDTARVARVVQEFGAEAVEPDRIYDVRVNVFAPCALGGILNEETIPRLQCDIVAGSANNQLAESRHGAELVERGILYAPDYVINAGGVISVYGELNGWTAERAKKKAGEIYDTLGRLFALSRERSIPTHEAADQLARERIEAVGRLHRTWV